MSLPVELQVYIGYDERESVAYHVAAQSIIENTSHPLIQIIPLRTEQLTHSGIYDREFDPNSSNAFSYTRFLVPHLSGFVGTSIYIDPDVVVKGDIKDLFDLTSDGIFSPVWVAKHDYTPKRETKYFGAKQHKYPRKNWSSVMVFKNSACIQLTPEYVNKASPQDLHQMKWVGENREVGALPLEWNWLVGEYPENPYAELLHYTNGIPMIDGVPRSEHSIDWWEYYSRMKRARK